MFHRLLLAIIVLLCAPLFSEECRAVSSAAIGVNVDRITFSAQDPVQINVFATVCDRSGLIIKNLAPENFHLIEDGVSVAGKMELRPFVVTDRELAFTILVDHRDDLATSLTYVRQGIMGFLEEMGVRYQGAVVSYTNQPRLIAGPSQGSNRLLPALMNLEPVSGRPYLYEGLLLGIQTLSNMSANKSAAPDRLAIILLTEGLDQGSIFSLEAVESKLIEAGINLFLVGYGPGEGRTMAGLSEAARRTGGDSYQAAGSEEIKSLLTAIADRLKNQYVMTYSSDRIGLDGQSHSMEVEIWRQGQRGRGRLEFISPQKKGDRTTGPLVFMASGVILALLIWLGVRIRRRGSARAGKPGEG